MFEITLFLILFFLCVSYGILHWQLFNGVRTLSHPHSTEQHSFSVIVAARNEEKNIRQCVESILRQDYDPQKFEIIIVNDRSSDSTAALIESLLDQHKNLHLLTVNENNTSMPHKKNALTIGINASRNDILAFTDADCVVPKDWLSELSKQFEETVGAVAGYSPNNLEKVSLGAKFFLHFEELINSIYAAAGVGLHHAFMCTGRNFAYRKKVFYEVGGFDKIKHSISGDDDLFIQLIQRETRWKIRYMVTPESFVTTTPPRSLSQFINQRTRHISASKFYPRTIKQLYALNHIFSVVIIFSFFWIPLSALVVGMIKINAEGILVAKGKEIFHEEISISEFFVGEIVIILYTLLIGPIAFIKKFQWKGTASA